MAKCSAPGNHRHKDNEERMLNDVSDSRTEPTFLADYRPPDYLIPAISLDFELDKVRTVVTAQLSVRRQPTIASDKPLVLNGEALELLEISVDGKALPESGYILTDKALTILDCPDAFTLTLKTACSPQDNKAYSGLYASGAMLCTQCEAEGFRRICFFPDKPDVLAAFKVRLIGDKAKYPVLLSNGNPDGAGDLDDGRHWTAWDDPIPKPCYLFALVAGDLIAVRDQFVTKSGKDVALAVYVEEKDADKCDYALGALERSMRWDEEQYGREYDLDVFNIVAADVFVYGAMENKGLNIFNSERVLASPASATDAEFASVEDAVGHEYFHNWSGNRVTCRDWFQLSLKEGFTVFREQQFSAQMRDEPVERIQHVRKLKSMQYREDDGPFAHSVRPEHYVTIDNFYTATVYQKGAEIIRMLHTFVGEARFRQGCDLYFERHDGQAVTIEDFVRAHEAASGVDLTQFRRWYEVIGRPALDIDSSYDPSAKRLTLKIEQRIPEQPEGKSIDALHIPLRVGLVFSEGSANREHLIELTQAVQEVSIDDVPQRPTLSLLRDLSAPVNVNVRQDLHERLTLISRDDNAFNRYAATRSLLLDVMADKAGEHRLENANDALSAYAQRLADQCVNDVNPAFLAEVLTLPAPEDVALTMGAIDPEGVTRAVADVTRSLADAVRPQLWALYERFEKKGTYSPDAESVARRSIRKAVLRLLVASEDKSAGAVALEHWRQSDNMTDAAAAIEALAFSSRDERETALQEFHDAWLHDSRILNKWFSWQAASVRVDPLDVMERLVEHEKFAKENPNSIRSLIGAFARNMNGFHHPEGRTYSWYSDQLRLIDAKTPQLAARLLDAFSSYNKLIEPYRSLTNTCLCEYRDHDGLSRNSLERISQLLSCRP